jgi:hypothetical protein
MNFIYFNIFWVPKSITIALRLGDFTKSRPSDVPMQPDTSTPWTRLCTCSISLSAQVISYQNIRGFLEFVYKLNLKHQHCFAVSPYFDEA